MDPPGGGEGGADPGVHRLGPEGHGGPGVPALEGLPGEGALRDRIAAVSVSGARNTAYLALKEQISVEELRSALETGGHPVKEVSEIQTFRERILAFI